MTTKTPFKPTLNEEQRAAFRALFLAIEPFYQMKPQMPLSYLRTLCLVGMEEGKSVNEYAADAKITSTVMTRNLMDVGDRNRHREEGLGLITQERDLYDLRRQNARFTAKGSSWANVLVQAFKTFCRDAR